MSDQTDNKIKQYLESDDVVFVAERGQVTKMNEACGRLFGEDYLIGYELEYLIGEVDADTLLDVSSEMNYSFSNIHLGFELGDLRMIHIDDALICIFNPRNSEKRREALHIYRSYADSLHETNIDKTLVREDPRARIGDGTRRSFSDPEPGSLVPFLRRRQEQIFLLGRCLYDLPPESEFDDLQAFCRDVLAHCAGKLNGKISFERKTEDVFSRAFSHFEIERMLACLLSGTLGLCRKGPIDVSLSIEGELLCVELSCDDPAFNEENFSAALIFNPDISGFRKDGRGLEFLIANEVAHRHGGRLEFVRSGKSGRLRATIPASSYSIDIEFRGRDTLLVGHFSQCATELCEYFDEAE